MVNVLTSWGYVNVQKIKTRPDPFLKIVVKRTPDFQEKFDTFAKALEEKRQERIRIKEEEEATKASLAAETKSEEAKP